ncbi:50S ribosomal protein L24 [Calidifontibacter indicus]|uniref:Large ribosomal subunit protein uL24 n=1 Tax=Calidifontibacter indicus TaxID=419650 RepID=A0A3D9V4J2_9MICO|nr:50S ribosomal protein L24 [Calidifontibacter indicus]REF32091.1 large subunit ribosomal protein L24 [Calidifontibacter indicus]
MAKMKIKKNDLVQVISGPDKGKQGKVISVNTETQRVLVEGVNRVTKHLRAGQPGQASGGIQVVEAPIHVSNVMIVDPETGKPTRVKTRVETVERDGRTKTVRTRVSVRSGKDL